MSTRTSKLAERPAAPLPRRAVPAPFSLRGKRRERACGYSPCRYPADAADPIAFAGAEETFRPPYVPSYATPRWTLGERIMAVLGFAALAAAVALPAPAEASLFGKKKPKTDFTTTMPSSQPLPPPPPPVMPLPPAQANGAIFQVSAGYAPLYEGWRAKRVGDPLTIVLVERTLATKSSGSQLDSNGNFAITPPSSGPLAFDPGASKVGGNRGFKGQGTADQSNSLSGELSVTVAAVYPNGTMLVQGTKRVVLNRGDEFMQIRGLIRMADVDQDNRVPSTRVADAQIEYTGKGDVARAARQGWLNRFFSVISPF